MSVFKTEKRARSSHFSENDAEKKSDKSTFVKQKTTIQTKQSRLFGLDLFLSYSMPIFSILKMARLQTEFTTRNTK